MASASDGTVNYREVFFEYPDCTKILGEPTFETVKILEDELKANAQAVYSPLGGGQHGHLGLVLAPFLYSTISATPFQRPNPPAPFIIDPNEAAHVAQARLDNHNSNIRLFREVTGVKKALLQQIVRSVDAAYLKPLRNQVTNTLEHLEIYDILGYLYQNHGYISPQKLKEYEDQVRNMSYDPASPIDNVFSAVDNLSLVAYRAGSEYSHAHKINMAYVIISHTGLYQSALQKWLQLPVQGRTWEMFKIHFRTAYNLLRVTTEGTLRDSKFHNANLVQQVIDGVHTLLLETDTAPPVESSPEPIVPPPAPLAYPMANAVQSDSMPLLLQQMNQMQTMMMDLQRQILQVNTNTSRVPPAPGPAPAPPAPNPRRRQRFYCWTHGNGYHLGVDCKAKADGHKDEATKSNRMGGSNRGCQRS